MISGARYERPSEFTNDLNLFVMCNEAFMEQERIGFLLGDDKERNEFFKTHVHFKGKFLKPKGGYKMTEDDKKNTEYCFNKLVNQLRYG